MQMVVRLIEVRATTAALASLDIPPGRRQGEWATVPVEPARCKSALGAWLADNVRSTRPSVEPRLMVERNVTRARQAFEDFAVEAEQQRIGDRAEAEKLFAQLEAFAVKQGQVIAAADTDWFARSTDPFEWPSLGETGGATFAPAPQGRAPTVEEELLRGELRYLCNLPQRELTEAQSVLSFLLTYVQKRRFALASGASSWFEPAAMAAPRSGPSWRHFEHVPSEPEAYFDYCAKRLDWDMLAERVWLEGTAVSLPDDLLMMRRRARRAGPTEPATLTESLSY